LERKNTSMMTSFSWCFAVGFLLQSHTFTHEFLLPHRLLLSEQFYVIIQMFGAIALITRMRVRDLHIYFTLFHEKPIIIVNILH
jgi:hypothetical protein